MKLDRPYLGIDVGSTTVKTVVLDGDGSVLSKAYGRHNAKQIGLLRSFLLNIEREFSGVDFKAFITGSGGRGLSSFLGARYIQEVNGAAFAVESKFPDVNSVVELGGQDAKVIFFKRDESGRKTTQCFMNDKCAGGTGATLDKILGKIGMDVEEAAKVTLEGKNVHPVAAKCGVFAETDVVGLAKSGVSPEEILVSVCTAMVKQNLEVLVKGNVLRDKVLLLGGPHSFIPVFTEIWRRFIPELWGLHGWKPREGALSDLVFVPPHSEYFSAIGAVLFGTQLARLNAGEKDENLVYAGAEALDRYEKDTRGTYVTGSVGTQWVSDGSAGLEAFKKRYGQTPFKTPDYKSGTELQLWLGVDGGSTSSKLALIDDEGQVVYRDYVLSTGNSISDLREFFKRLQKWESTNKIRLNIRGGAVTGYAADILKEAFCFDFAVVETVAHLRSAQFYYGDVDIVCDVGGQDIKVLFLGDGRVKNFRLNTQCSAGNGYFLQWIADQFNVPIEDFADRAFRAERAPLFNCGCAVFMEQDKVNFQQLGWTEDEIMAGLALVLPVNIWKCVVQESNIAKFGKRVLLQGGTQRNLAAVKAQVDYLEKKIPGAVVDVHKYADICGAIGAAIEAKTKMGKNRSRFVGIPQAASVEFSTKCNDSTRCPHCHNQCPRTFVDIQTTPDNKVRFIAGNGCEKGSAKDTAELKKKRNETREILDSHPNLVELASNEVFEDVAITADPGNESFRNHTQLERRKKMVFGIPRLLNLYFYAPFFNAYLRSLGVGGVVPSRVTSQKLWERGNKWGCIDPCFPAKVAPAHVFDLLHRKGITHIMFPMVTHLPSHVENTLGNNACVIQMGTSEVVDAAFTKNRDQFREKGIEFLKPLVKLDRPKEAEAQLFEFFDPILGVTESENQRAVKQGYAALDGYISKIQAAGRDTINELVRSDKIGLVVLGHPYHHDPGLNHGLLLEFQKRGYPVLSIESLPTDNEFLKPLFGTNGNSPRSVTDIWPRNFNRNTNHKLWAAKVVARHPNLVAVDLSSFKCGHDAPTYSYIEKMMNDSGTPHFLFHDIDQNKPHASLKIRVQTFDYFLKQEERNLRLASRSKK